MVRCFLLGLAFLAVTLPATHIARADGAKGHEHHQPHSPAGAPGDPAKVSKVIQVRMLDSMRFEPSHIEVRSGQTVKFVVTNTGKIRHEFGVGTHDEQKAHAEMMLADPDMKHEDGSAITVEPGQTRELIWRFGKPGLYEAACQVPGHYPAGMMSTIVVKGKAS
jgi:uncharacterized cupredoxin-like copper-binding protein